MSTSYVDFPGLVWGSWMIFEKNSYFLGWHSGPCWVNQHVQGNYLKSSAVLSKPDVFSCGKGIEPRTKIQ